MRRCGVKPDANHHRLSKGIINSILSLLLMALASRLRGPPPASSRKTACALGAFATSIPAEDGEALLAATANDEWPLTQVVEATRSEYPDKRIPHYSTFQRHRATRCACFGAA